MNQQPAKLSSHATYIHIPLIVDLDGTLTPTDTLIESIIRLVKNNPADLIRLPFWMLRGRSFFKSIIASRINFSAKTLPYRLPLVDYLRSQKEKGRRIILATASHQSIAESVATELGLFDGILASNKAQNLKGINKLEAIQEKVGEKFVYAGDSAADLPIWKAAEAAILVGVSSRVAQIVQSYTSVEREFPKSDTGVAIWLQALRIYQWLKNLLLFVPIFTAFSFFDIGKLTVMIFAFFAFSLAASATYLINDLWDLESDRAHPRKRNRPLASASISILSGIAVAAGLLLVALMLAASISVSFLLMLLLYIALTSIYSLVLKGYVLIDVLILSLLYTLRILAGSVASDTIVSSWLLVFSLFIFLSLALVKRCSELIALDKEGQESTHGRDYRVTDLTILWPLGVGSALCAVVIFSLFITADETQIRYLTPELLWFTAIGIIYWLARLWIKAAREEMHDDPLVFAIKDFGSRITILMIILSAFAAHFLDIQIN
jgi:4-hydroxybenzoate polyprenyltransferase